MGFMHFYFDPEREMTREELEKQCETLRAKLEAMRADKALLEFLLAHAFQIELGPYFEQAFTLKQPITREAIRQALERVK